MKDKKFNLAERFKKNEMTIDKEVADELMNNEELEEANNAIHEIVAEKTIEETIREATKTGVVVGCNKLNMRFTPKLDGSVICILTNADKVEVDTRFDDPEFYKVTTVLGIEGYCMKKYIFVE